METQFGRSVACKRCSQKKKRCVFPTLESLSCVACFRRGESCVGGRQRPFVNFGAVTDDQVPPPSSLVGLSWKLNTRVLSFSLTHHLLSLHIRHRPPRMFGGILEHEWDGIGDISLSVNGKVDELSPVIQALVGIGLADGARLSTHSAIVGVSQTPFPQFGDFSSADKTLIALGSRRRDAVDRLNSNAMERLDAALSSLDGVDPSMKLQLLWIASMEIVDTPHSRLWCREMSVRCAKYILECLGREDLDYQDKMKLYEQSFAVVMLESLRSASFGVKSPFTRHEYITAIPYMAFPSPPIYYPIPSEFDLILTPYSVASDLTPLFAFNERLFIPWRLRYIKVVFLLTQCDEEVSVMQLVTLIWSWVDKIYDFVEGYFSHLFAHPRYLEVEQSRGSTCWESWVLLHMVMKHLFMAESIYLSMNLGCHMRLVQEFGRGDGRELWLLSISQKRLYETLRRMNFIAGLRDIRLDFHEYDPFVLGVQLIVRAPENGPCSNISLEDFPNILKTFEFMSFSNAECGDFLKQYGHNIGSDCQAFADGTTVSDLPPWTLVAPCSRTPSPSEPELAASSENSPSSTPAATTEDNEKMASEMFNSALESLSQDSSSPSEISLSKSTKSPSTEAAVTLEMESIVVQMFSPRLIPRKTKKERIASDLVAAALKGLTEDEEVGSTVVTVSMATEDKQASRLDKK